ncbi:MAG: CPBP family intramembrane metalloprotease [Lachnospiraceae bacterium]|nr:CPBP family intramembrane metalloprotease [Lachnospiraceae bacterium]
MKNMAARAGILIRSVYMLIVYVIVGMCVGTAAASASMDVYRAHPMLWTLISALIVIPLCMVEMKHQGYLKEEASRRGAWADWIFLVILAVSSCIALNYWIAMSGLMKLFPGFEKVAESIYGGSLLEELLAVALAAPVVEELLFRGLAYRGFKVLWGRNIAMFAASLLFGVYHGNFVQGLYAFLIGMLLVYVYEAFGTIWAPVIFHVAANLVSIVMTECLDMTVVTESILNELVFTIFFTVTGILAFAALKRSRRLKKTDLRKS